MAYEPMAYVVRASCGCLIGLAVDDGTPPVETATFFRTVVAEAILAGGWVERVTLDEARGSEWGHRCGPVAAQNPLPGLGS